MDEKLVEIRDSTHPSEAEEPRRWAGPDGRDEICERRLRQRAPSPFREAAPCSGNDKSGRGEIIMFTQNKVRGKVVGRPRREHRRSLRAELVHQVAELLPLD